MISERALPLSARPVRVTPDRFELRGGKGRPIDEQEEERKRISRELHDGPLQDIAALVLKIEFIREQSGGSERTASDLGELQQQVFQLGQKIRLISRNLHPSTLDFLGLAGALNALGNEFQQQGLHVRVDVPSENPRLDEQSRLCLFRIAQEALRNVLKHARCSHADLKLYQHDRHIVLTITDHGAGFDLKQRRSGLGLVSMKERVALLRGSLELQSTRGGGTQIRVVVPAK